MHCKADCISNYLLAYICEHSPYLQAQLKHSFYIFQEHLL